MGWPGDRGESEAAFKEKLKTATGGDPDGLVFSADIKTIVKLTQAAYDALDPPDASTLYVIVG
jgi:hypothetical protein